MLHFSRSFYDDFTECERKAYYGYLYRGSGLSPKKQSMALGFGIAMHEGLAKLLTTGGDIDEAIQAGVTSWMDEGLKADLTPEKWQEMNTLLKGLLYGWYRLKWNAFNEEYYYSMVEEEVMLPLAGNVILHARPDAVLKHRITGANYVLNWKCELPDTRLDTYAGSQLLAKDVKVGDILLDRAGKATKVTGVGSGGVQPCYEVVTAKGRRLRFSGNHPFLVKDRWKAARDLEPGDSLTLAARHGVVPLPVSEARLLGYIVGDGSATGSVIFTSAEPEIQAHIYELWPDTKVAQKKGKTLDFRLNGAVPLMRTHGLFGKKSKDKEIPAAVLRGDSETAKHFLGAYFDCDGSISLKSKTGQSKVSFYSASRELLAGVQLLLTRLGIPSAIWQQTNKRYLGKPYEFYWLYIQDSAGVAKFAHTLLPYLRRISKIDRLRPLARDVDPPVVDWVKEVTYIGNCATIAIETASHTLVSDSVVTHNTSSSINDWDSQWEYAIQTWTEALAIQETIGEYVDGCIYEGFFKGSTYNGMSTSPFTRGYMKLWEDGTQTFSAKKEEGYKLFRIDDTFTLGPGLEGVRGWTDWLPEHILEAQFVRSNPIMKDDDLVHEWLKQVVRYLSDAEHMLTIPDESDRLTFFKQKFGKQCKWCHFNLVCKKQVGIQDMLEEGTLLKREDHHGIESVVTE